ncbi:MAG: Lrp/AsnC family transcriptional regulator [Deltaproteobacteria bacterium]|nr:Lrp/AsnC family transcriptional regulator [Deltaproteobacteria bacterium]
MLLDDIDLALIKELEKDARISSDLLAKSLDISSTTIRRRTRRLIQEDVIKIVAIPDLKKLGYSFIVGIQMELDQKKIENVTKELIKHPNVRSVWTVTERYNLTSMTVFKATEEFSEFMRAIVGEFDGLKSVETNIYLELIGSQSQVKS